MSIANFEKLTQLTGTPVPPMFEAAMGYPGCNRFVVFYYDAEMQEVRYDDGKIDGEADFEAWEIFMTHEAVRHGVPYFAPDLDQPATHMLFLDRHTRQFSVGRVGFLTEALRAAMADEALPTLSTPDPCGATFSLVWWLDAMAPVGQPEATT